MNRYLLIFAIIAAIIFGLGYVIFKTLITEQPESSAMQPDRKAPTPPSLSKQDLQSHTDSSSSRKPSQGFLVTSVTGLVERSEPDKENWKPVSPGDRLQIDEFVRTGMTSSVKLAFDEKSEIDLAGQSEISVQDITETIHQIKLELGRIDVNYEESGGRTLRITSTNNEAVAETQTAKFAMQNIDGQISVATTTGEVKLTAKDKTVTVGTGEFSRVAPGQEPRPVEPIPLSVMLVVAKPGKRAQDDDVTTITGRTNIGARVNADGVQAKVNRKGRFKIVMPLRGKKHIEVVADTVWGSAKKTIPMITVRQKATVDSAKVRWGKKTKKVEGGESTIDKSEK
ncbi:MAG: FecR domain-containing protein [Proteobacteria bacterium]|nr:FecR domain-containing protein [Pseudomonadota bacterium]